MGKALFIPLKTGPYEAFASGEKRDELRAYGPRWNERTCPVGRDVVLSKGYGKHHRLTGRIQHFRRQHGGTFGSTNKAAIRRHYGTLDLEIAVIGLIIWCPGCQGSGEFSDGSQTCPPCKGSGVISSVNRDTDTKKCPECGGAGHFGAEPFMEVDDGGPGCGRCNGAGQISVKRTQEPPE